MKQVIGVIFLVVTMLAVTANATLMLISPRIWSRIPEWCRLSGSHTRRKHESGWGAVQVRVLGACFLAVIVWMLAHALYAR